MGGEPCKEPTQPTNYRAGPDITGAVGSTTGHHSLRSCVVVQVETGPCVPLGPRRFVPAGAFGHVAGFAPEVAMIV